MRKVYKYKSFLLLLTLIMFTVSCSKEFLEPTVTTAKDVNTSINKVEDLQALIVGAYDRMNEVPYYGRNYVVYAEVRSNNAFSSGSSGRFVEPGQFALEPTYGYVSGTWNQIYRVIASANLVIQSEVEDNESAAVKFVKGQAYTIRALAYMDLLRLYGQQWSGGDLGVPLVTEFRGEDQTPARASVQEIWAQVENDLNSAVTSMDPSFNGNNTTITSWVAYGLQSRYYLYTKQYEKAAAAAKVVIDSGAYFLSDQSSFLSSWGGQSGNNVMFQLAIVGADNLIFDSIFQVYQATTYGDIQVTPDLYNLYEASDIRQSLYSVDGDVIRMIGKYPSADYTDNIKVIRYAEVVLNYAEALARSNSTEALTYLNLVAETRNASAYTEASIDNVLLERRKELAMEGFGFFELVRNGQGIPYVDSRQTFSPSGIPFGSNLLAFPIPQSEMLANPNEVQNDGY